MTVQSPLRASWRWTSQTSPHRLLIHPTVASTSEWWKGKRRMMSCCFSFSFFFLFQLETQGAPSISRYRNFVSFVVFVLSCLLDQSFHSCFKQTDKKKVAASFQLLIYKQTRRLFFNRKLYMEHFNYALFLFFGFVLSFLPLSPLPGFFCKKRRIPLRLYWSPPDTTDTAIKHWSLEKHHALTHTHTLTTFVLLYIRDLSVVCC